MRKSTSTLLPTIAALLAAGAFGAAAAGAAIAFASERQIIQAQRETANAVARVKLLESVIRRQADHAVSLVGSPELASADLQTPPATTGPTHIGQAHPAALAQAEPKPSPTPAAPVTAPAPATTKASAKADLKTERQAAAAPAIATKVVVATAAKLIPASPTVATAATTTPDAPSAEVDVVVVTPDAVATARKNNRIEGVDGSKLGVLKLDPSGVELKNGRTIHPGGKFPSGERLLAIDQANGQIVTDRRTILVF